MKTTTNTICSLAACLALFLSGCQSGNQTEAQTGATIGAIIGAGIGALAGGNTEATLIGGAVGGGIGYGLGNECDKKAAAAEMEQLRQEMNTVTVWVTNSNRSYTPVKLRRHGYGYLGPMEEYYYRLPSSGQLRRIYGF